MDQVLYGIDYIEYYFYWIYYKFIGYPLIIRICSIAVMFCIIAYLFLLFHIIYGIFKRRKEKRRYNKAFDKYYEEMKSISLDSNTLSEEEIADRLQYDTKKRPKPNELRIITQLLTEIKSVHEDEINELNYQTIQTVFQITRFLERELQFGSKRAKIQALKLIQSINGYASEAVLVRFLYHREIELKNSARYTYMWLSQGDPFRFFDEDIGMKLRQWDMMELHAILEHRKKVGYNTPSFIKWVNTSAEENVKIFFINEIRLYNETDSAPILAKQIIDDYQDRDEITNRVTRHVSENTGHGRIETRTCTVVSYGSIMEKMFKKKLVGLKSIVGIKSERTIVATGEYTQEVRYYVTSLDNTKPEEIASAIRQHWSIENNLHWQLDVTFREDYSKKVKNAARNFSVATKMALTILKKDKTTKGSMNLKRLKAGWDEKYLSQLLQNNNF